MTKKQTKRALLKVGEALMLRTCDAEGKSYSGFQWPKSGEVSCPDWKPKAACGNGLHGLLWGVGDGSLLDWNESAKWLVVRVLTSETVAIDTQKVKVPRGEVVYYGDRLGAVELIAQYSPANSPIVGGTATAGDGGTATAGYRGTATAGDRGTATAGDRGTATAGYRGTATAGYRWNRDGWRRWNRDGWRRWNRDGWLPWNRDGWLPMEPRRLASVEPRRLASVEPRRLATVGASASAIGMVNATRWPRSMWAKTTSSPTSNTASTKRAKPRRSPNERPLAIASTRRLRHSARQRCDVAVVLRRGGCGRNRGMVYLEDAMKRCAECGMPTEGDDLFCCDACYDVFVYSDEDEGLPPSPVVASTENLDELPF